MKQQRDELHEYLQEFQDPQTGKIKYAELAADLKDFNYDLETNEGILPKGPQSISSGRYSIQGGQKHNAANDYVILDSQHVPQNKLETIERQMVKVNRFMQDKFGTLDNLNSKLKEFADSEKNGNINVDQFKDFLTSNLSKELAERRVTKRDLEGFMSAFVYNRYGATNINSIAPLVFEKDANTLSLKLATVVRANPPPEFVNEDLGLTKPVSLDDNNQAKRIRDLLQEIEIVSYSGNPSTYSLFKAFDVDGDGFVSHKDFERHLKFIKINASAEEIEALMKNVIDVNGKGYVGFEDFSKRFGPNMSKTIKVKENQSQLPNL